MKPTDIKTSEPFENLLPVDNATLNAIIDDMRIDGFDPAHPVVVWKEKGVLVDGHTRLQAAIVLGLKDIPVSRKAFGSEDAAVEYSIHSQRDRRNLSDSEIARLVGVLDKRKDRGGDTRSMEAKTKAQGCALKKGAAETAATLGTSARKVEQVRTVMDHGTEETKQEMLDGKKSVNKAYKETQKTRRKQNNKLTPKEKREVEALPPQVGLWQAERAIHMLEAIEENDTERQQAFDTVKGWIKDHESKTKT